MATLGVDVSHWQPPNLPWPAWRDAGVGVVVIQLSQGESVDSGAAVHLAHVRAAGFPVIGGYHFLLDHDDEVPHYDPVAQARIFLGYLDPAVFKFGMLDIEADGITEAEVRAFKRFYMANCALPLVLYGDHALEPLLGADNPEYADCLLLVSDYGYFAPGTKAPPLRTVAAGQWSPPMAAGLPRVPRVGRKVGHQGAGNNGRLAPYTGAIDLSLWDEVPGMLNPNHVALGPHHMQGGMAAGAWLQLGPKVAKAVGDLGALSTARPETLTIGRLVDAGQLAGQGFDVNRYVDQGVTPAAAADLYLALLAPYIKSNPWIQVWEGPNEQVPRSDDAAEAQFPDVAAHYQADRQAFMTWYAEFAYQFASRLHGLGKRAGVGSWASGTPRVEHDLVRWWWRALEATVTFGAVQCFHDYAADATLAHARYLHDQFEQLGYHQVDLVATELGLNETGGGWKSLYPSWDACYAAVVRPWLDAAAGLGWELAGCWYTDGTAGAHQWDGFDVSGTDVVSLLAAYVPPEVNVPITTAQKQAMQTAAATLTAQINALVPDDAAPAKHTLAGLTGQQVINLFFKVFGDYNELAAAGMPSPLTTAWRNALYAGPAVEDMALTAAQKAAIVAALPAG